MAIRIVEATDTIKTAAQAELFVYRESGYAVFRTGETRRIEGGWAVSCFSTDGRPRAMDRPDPRRPASSLPDLPVIETVPEPNGWTPYFSKPRDAGK